MSLLGAQACGSDDGNSDAADANKSTAQFVCFIAPIVLEQVFKSLELPNGLDNGCETLLTNWLDTGSAFTAKLELPDGVTKDYTLPTFTPSTRLSQAEIEAAIARLQAAMADN
jgi:hypothetical protein